MNILENYYTYTYCKICMYIYNTRKTYIFHTRVFYGYFLRYREKKRKKKNMFEVRTNFKEPWLLSFEKVHLTFNLRASRCSTVTRRRHEERAYRITFGWMSNGTWSFLPLLSFLLPLLSRIFLMLIRSTILFIN